MATKIKTLQLNNEVFPYTDAAYGVTDTRVTGKHFVMYLAPEIPEAIVEKSKKYGVTDIQDYAIARVLDKYPHYQELTSFGTYKKGFWSHVRTEMRSVFYWIVNKQPASITFVTNKIDGLTRKDDEITDPNSLYGKIQLCLQLGVTVQIVIPETGYSCRIESVINKNLMEIFTKDFICEEYRSYLDNWEMRDDDNQVVKDIIAICKDANIDLLTFAIGVHQKCERLQDYRQAVQDNIWKLVNYALAPYRNEWRCQNAYTMETRMAFAVNSQTEDILNKYASDMRIPDGNKMTLKDLQNPETFNEMIRIIQVYGPAFGVSVKTTETEADSTTYMPEEWLRKPAGVKHFDEAYMLKQYMRVQQSLKRAPLNELLQAYIQIDWYMSQDNMEEFLAPDYSMCECGKPVREMVTHYWNSDRQELLDLDEYTEYFKFYNRPGESETVYPVTVCQYCNKMHEALEWEMAEPVSYEYLAYKLDKDQE